MANSLVPEGLASSGALGVSDGMAPALAVKGVDLTSGSLAGGRS